MDRASSSYRVHRCSKCLGDAEYCCVSCPCDLCPQCKENHAKDLKTIDHDVVSHRDKINYIPTTEICVRHPSEAYTKYCEPCQVPVCYHCREHKNHRQIDVKTAFETKLQEYKETIHSIRSKALFYRPVLLTGAKAAVKTCHTELSLHQSEWLTKAKKLKNLIDYVLYDPLNNMFRNLIYTHSCLKQKRKMSRYIVSLQKYEYIYVQPAFAFSPLQFLSSIKTALPYTHFTLHTSKHFMNESLNKEDVMESLKAIHITYIKKRPVGNQSLLKLMSGAEFHQSFTLTGVDSCDHISCVTSGLVWVSDTKDNLILTNTEGVILHRVEDLGSRLLNGLHTVNSESELIYIDRNDNINKMSKDMKTTTTFIRRTVSKWRPRCVSWSSSTGDLLVGMCREEPWKGKVTRYNQKGQLTQTIKNNNAGQGLYKTSYYITENNNGDIVVSDFRDVHLGAVVVTDREGRHRFSYTGHPPNSRLWPRGICTDALSNILVCDFTAKQVQMIDKDGHFMSRLLTEQEIHVPLSLGYDVTTHRLWVGSWFHNKVCVYRYITREEVLTDEHERCTDGDAKLCSTPAVEWG